MTALKIKSEIVAAMAVITRLSVPALKVCCNMLRLSITLVLLGMSVVTMAAGMEPSVAENSAGGNEKALPIEEEVLPLPQTRLFEPLRSDPKEPRFFASFLSTRSDVRDTTVAAVGFGEDFGVIRRGSGADKGWQLGISAAVFAQFDLKTSSSDLMNADYIVGIPLTWRNHEWSGRFRVYHQSSHLGDEYILNAHPDRVNLSYESMEAVFAYDLAEVRLYGGGEYLFHREPTDLAQGLAHVGFDWRDEQPAFRIANLAGAHWVAGVDIKRWLQSDWAVQFSAKAGLEFAPNNAQRNSSRRWSVLMEYFDGPSPYGQFYRDDLRYIGIAVQLGL